MLFRSTTGHSRNGRIFCCHECALQAVKFAREKPSPKSGASDPSPWNSSGTSILRPQHSIVSRSNRGFANIARAGVQRDESDWRCHVAWRSRPAGLESCARRSCARRPPRQSRTQRHPVKASPRSASHILGFTWRMLAMPANHFAIQ